LASLTKDDLVQILTEPQNSLVRQYAELLKTENITLEFKEDGVQAVADIAASVNERMADIGARRLHTVMEKLLEQLSFDAPDMPRATIVVDRAMVEKRLGDLVEDQDLSQYIL
jgi:ATP-dependent HslUV protease ATP-binding subunit HslU